MSEQVEEQAAEDRAPVDSQDGTGKLVLDPRTLKEGLGLLVRYAREEPKWFGIAVGGSAVFAACTVGASTLVGHVTDVTIAPAIRRGDVRTSLLTGAALALVGLGLLKATGVVLRRIGAGVMQYRLQASYRQRIVRQYVRLPMAWHSRRPTGQLLSHASSDVEAMFWPIAPFPYAVGVLVMLVLAVIQLLSIDVALTSLGALVFAGVIGLNTISNRLQSPVAQQGQARRGSLASRAHESFDGAVVIKTLGREDAETATFTTSAEVLRDANIKLGSIRGVFDPLGEAVPSLGVMLMLFLGADRVASGSVSPGQLVTASYLFVQLAQPIRALGWVLAELPRAVAGARRVDAVLAETARTPWGPDSFPVGGPVALRVENLRHGYLPGQEVLRGVDLDVPAGKTLAIVGATGSGKSTLAELLVRLEDPDSGRVLWDGVDVRTLREGEIAGAGAFVPQGTFIFDDTVRENVTLGVTATDAEVDAALAAAQATGFVAELPDGLATELGERGTTLSGGQRQRLALARALVRRPRLLVLDDATSAVDPHIEQAILDALRVGHGATLVVVAYRRSTISLADEVAFLADGVVVARGTHSELIATVEAYRDLVTAYDDELPDGQAQLVEGPGTEEGLDELTELNALESA